MATTKQATKQHGSPHIMDSVERIERSSLDAIRRMVDSVDGAIPVMLESAPRRKIIDSTFEVVAKVMDASTDFTRSILNVSDEDVRVAS